MYDPQNKTLIATSAGKFNTVLSTIRFGLGVSDNRYLGTGINNSPMEFGS
jgi:hypothetical protein